MMKCTVTMSMPPRNTAASKRVTRAPIMIDDPPRVEAAGALLAGRRAAAAGAVGVAAAAPAAGLGRVATVAAPSPATTTRIRPVSP